MKFASPTFLFRQQCPEKLDEILAALSRLGFDGVELYGMFGYSAGEIRALCDRRRIALLCDHVPYERFTAETGAVLRDAETLGLPFLTVDRIPDGCLPGAPGFPRAVDELHRLGRACRDRGIQLLYHSHGYDLIRKVDGRPQLDLILDGTDPQLLKLQPDLGWIALGGGDPRRYLQKYRDRCPVVHLKDYYAAAPVLLESPFPLGDSRGGPAYHDFEFRPSGFGVMNFPALMDDILACRPQWITTDHDLSYERDTYPDMKMGLDYVKFLVSVHEGTLAARQAGGNG